MVLLQAVPLHQGDVQGESLGFFLQFFFTMMTLMGLSRINSGVGSQLLKTMSTTLMGRIFNIKTTETRSQMIKFYFFMNYYKYTQLLHEIALHVASLYYRTLSINTILKTIYRTFCNTIHTSFTIYITISY